MVWPGYTLHGEVTNRLWPWLYEDLPQFQFGLYDHASELLAEGDGGPAQGQCGDTAQHRGVTERSQ